MSDRHRFHRIVDELLAGRRLRAEDSRWLGARLRRKIGRPETDDDAAVQEMHVLRMSNPGMKIKYAADFVMRSRGIDGNSKAATRDRLAKKYRRTFCQIETR